MRTVIVYALVRHRNTKQIIDEIADKHDTIVGRFSCKGFDTFDRFKLIGGVSKWHSEEKEIVRQKIFTMD